jgi:hypothetical protein
LLLFLGTAEFKELFYPGADRSESQSSFEVTVTGEWFWKGDRNPFSGVPTTAIVVEPIAIKCGSTIGKANDWASLEFRAHHAGGYFVFCI